MCYNYFTAMNRKHTTYISKVH